MFNGTTTEGSTWSDQDDDDDDDDDNELDETVVGQSLVVDMAEMNNDDCDESTNDETDNDDDDDDDDTEDDDTEDDDPLVLVHAAWSSAVDKAMKGLEKKIRSLQSEYDKAQMAEAMMQRAQLIVSNMYMFSDPSIKTAQVHDWENDGVEIELTLDAQYESASAEADSLFAQARKLRRGSKIVEELLAEATDSMDTLQECKTDLQSALTGRIDDNDGQNVDNNPSLAVDHGRLLIVQSRLERSSRQTKFQAPDVTSTSTKPGSGRSNSKNNQSRTKKGNNNNNNNNKNANNNIEMQIRRMKSPGGCTVLVGRNRRGNEYLSMSVARGDDIWMHARGCPGAHVLIQVRRGGVQPTDDCLAFAANLAAFYSDARNERKASITAAEPKHILKPRGAPLGAVKLREELYTIMGRPDDVPEECKVARDASGLADEYRSADKAKHRRRTLQVAKQNQAKQRAAKRANKRKRRAGSGRDGNEGQDD